MRPASVERGEPRKCYDFWNIEHPSVWYSFTPTTDMHVSVDSFHSNFSYATNNYDSTVAVYTGSSLADLTQVACGYDWAGLQARTTFAATAGTTYHVQLGGHFFQLHSSVAELDIHQFDPTTDKDGDLWSDVRERACGSIDTEPQSRPERIDTVLHDDDYDSPWTPLNEPLPPGAEPYDCDGDGYTGEREAAIGTNDQDPCGTNGWPSDLVVGFQPNTLNIEDLGSFVAPVRRFNTSPGHPNFDQRWNLSPAPSIGGAINLADIAAVITSETGYPLMFGWQRAFGKTCRWPP
jgi:hypothetical protein